MHRNDIVVGRWPFSILLTVPRLSGSSCEGPSTESSGLSQSPDDLAHAIGQKSALLRAWAVVNVGLAAKVL